MWHSMNKRLDPVRNSILSPNHPIKANKELRKHLSPVSRSGHCHYMLISPFSAKANMQPVDWPGHQRFKPHHPLFSRDGSHLQEAALIKPPPPPVAGKCSLPSSLSLKWPDSLPVDMSSVRQLALPRNDFMQFSHISRRHIFYFGV